MSTTLSMPSPHGHHALSHGSFATSLQLSPAFRSLHAAALRQRQHEVERLRELASDEFSDDESDGDEEEEEEEEIEDSDEDDSEQEEEGGEEQQLPVKQAEKEEEMEARDDALGHDSDIDTDEIVLLPFIRPTVAVVARSGPVNDFTSPKADDWTIVDKSPTCEGLVYGNVDVSEAWFARP